MEQDRGYGAGLGKGPEWNDKQKGCDSTECDKCDSDEDPNDEWSVWEAVIEGNVSTGKHTS